MDKIDIELLKAIRDECEKSRDGAFTGVLLKICDDNMGDLLNRLDLLERKDGVINIGTHQFGHGLNTHGKLIAAGNITLTDNGKQFLAPHKTVNLFVKLTEWCKNNVYKTIILLVAVVTLLFTIF